MITARRHNHLFNTMEKEIIAALKKIKDLYGKPAAIKIEALFRNETKHFKSTNYAATYSPGMEATVDFMPYGWSSLAPFWKANPEYAPIGIHKQVENNSRMMASRGERSFIKFKSVEAGMMTVAARMEIKGWDTGAWASNNPASQTKYREYLLKIKTPYANAL